MEINLITHNKNKVKEFKLLLEPHTNVNNIDFDYPELRSDDPTDIVNVAAKSLAEKLQKTVVVEDSGFFIESLGDFPGTCTSYVHKRIGNEGIIKIMKGNKKRKCFYKSTIGYCEPGKEPISFLGIEEGKVADKPAGNKGWGQDPIFVPKGKQKTYGQIRSGNDVNLFRKRAIEKLKSYLK